MTSKSVRKNKLHYPPSFALIQSRSGIKHQPRIAISWLRSTLNFNGPVERNKIFKRFCFILEMFQRLDARFMIGWRRYEAGEIAEA